MGHSTPPTPHRKTPKGLFIRVQFLCHVKASPDVFSGRPGYLGTRSSHDFRGKPVPNRTTKLPATGFSRVAPRIEQSRLDNSFSSQV